MQGEQDLALKMEEEDQHPSNMGAQETDCHLKISQTGATAQREPFWTSEQHTYKVTDFCYF